MANFSKYLVIQPFLKWCFQNTISALELYFEYTVSLKMLSWLRWGGFFVWFFLRHPLINHDFETQFLVSHFTTPNNLVTLPNIVTPRPTAISALNHPSLPIVHCPPQLRLSPSHLGCVRTNGAFYFNLMPFFLFVCISHLLKGYV